jgi:hypothetical protein
MTEKTARRIYLAGFEKAINDQPLTRQQLQEFLKAERITESHREQRSKAAARKATRATEE